MGRSDKHEERNRNQWLNITDLQDDGDRDRKKKEGEKMSRRVKIGKYTCIGWEIKIMEMWRLWIQIQLTLLCFSLCTFFFGLSSAQPQANESPLKHENRKMKTIHKPPKERQRGWGQKWGQNAVEK